MAARPDMTLEVGCKVKAQSPDDEGWYPGRIKEASGSDWVVAWDDPDGGPETNTLSDDFIKKLFFHKNYEVGDDCRAISPDDERWYPGVVAEVLAEEKFRVKWDDPDGGPETADLHWEEMKKVKVKRDYKEGDEVLARFPEDGMMYEGTVLKANSDGTFQVKWEDPDGGPEDSPVSPKDMKIPPIPFDKLEVGQKYTGSVRSVRDFGAFVDIGSESDGLLHISAISEQRIEDIYAELEEDQEVEVWISGLRDDGKFGLTMIEGRIGGGGGRPRVDTDATLFEDKVEEWFDGEVVNIAPFGAFVKVTLDSGDEGQGLVHVSQIADTFVENINDFVEVGKEVRVKLVGVDTEKNKLSFTMRDGSGGGRPDREPVDLTPFEGIDPATWLKGTVARCASFGAFVDVKAPDSDATASGLVHITQIKDGFVESVEAELEVGQEVDVRVVSVDTGMGKMGLTMKPEDAE
jgi:predicted RNA-binding protein with RPS1 domain